MWKVPNYFSEFILGAAEASQFPEEAFPEIAFAGRSNVGKSSLINRLLNRKHLVRVSQTPGCTRQLNFLLVNQRWWFVDLPGYGYAKVGQAQANRWRATITRYLQQRRNLRAVVLILDPRRGLTAGDIQLIDFLNAAGLPYVPVATKLDKLGSNERRRLLGQLDTAIQAVGKLAITAPIGWSSSSGVGFEPLWQHLQDILGE